LCQSEGTGGCPKQPPVAGSEADPRFARRAEIIDTAPGLGEQAVAGLIAWAPSSGARANEAAANA
jgi:hypothetical protein